MNPSALTSAIPETKLGAVASALEEVFGVAEVDDLVLLAGGLSSALVYKIVVCGKPYALRLIMQVDPLSDPARQHACMQIASNAGIAPQVHYASTEDALAITDYVEARPLFGHFAQYEELLLKLVKTIQTIHAAPLFPKLIGFLDGVDIFIEHYKALNMLPESATREHFEYYAQIQDVYPRFDPDLVSSHNDLHPNNLLFDGQRVWVIDWEAAFQNDRYVDLAIVAKSFVTSEAQEAFFLKAYFGDLLDAYKRARFFLMQQVCHMYYAMIMLRFAAALRPAGYAYEVNMDTPNLGDFNRRQLGPGKVSLSSYEGQLLYGKVLLNEALQNIKTPRFAASIKEVDSGA